MLKYQIILFKFYFIIKNIIKKVLKNSLKISYKVKIIFF